MPHRRPPILDASGGGGSLDLDFRVGGARLIDRASGIHRAAPKIRFRGFAFPKGSRRSTRPIRGLAAAHGEERRLFAAISLSQPRLARTQAACRPQGKESPWCVSFRDAVRSVASSTRRSHRPQAGTADRRRIASRSGFQPPPDAKPATRAVAGRATVDDRHARLNARVDRDAITARTATRARSRAFTRRRRP